eukprot:754412-Hanusia_phi.AAC.2
MDNRNQQQPDIREQRPDYAEQQFPTGAVSFHNLHHAGYNGSSSSNPALLSPPSSTGSAKIIPTPPMHPPPPSSHLMPTRSVQHLPVSSSPKFSVDSIENHNAFFNPSHVGGGFGAPAGMAGAGAGGGPALGVAPVGGAGEEGGAGAGRYGMNAAVGRVQLSKPSWSSGSSVAEPMSETLSRRVFSVRDVHDFIAHKNKMDVIIQTDPPAKKRSVVWERSNPVLDGDVCRFQTLLCLWRNKFTVLVALLLVSGAAWKLKEQYETIAVLKLERESLISIKHQLESTCHDMVDLSRKESEESSQKRIDAIVDLHRKVMFIALPFLLFSSPYDLEFSNRRWMLAAKMSRGLRRRETKRSRRSDERSLASMAFVLNSRWTQIFDHRKERANQVDDLVEQDGGGVPPSPAANQKESVHRDTASTQVRSSSAGPARTADMHNESSARNQSKSDTQPSNGATEAPASDIHPANFRSMRDQRRADEKERSMKKRMLMNQARERMKQEAIERAQREKAAKEEGEKRREEQLREEKRASIPTFKQLGKLSSLKDIQRTKTIIRSFKGRKSVEHQAIEEQQQVAAEDSNQKHIEPQEADAAKETPSDPLKGGASPQTEPHPYADDAADKSKLRVQTEELVADLSDRLKRGSLQLVKEDLSLLRSQLQVSQEANLEKSISELEELYLRRVNEQVGDRALAEFGEALGMRNIHVAETMFDRASEAFKRAGVHREAEVGVKVGVIEV